MLPASLQETAKDVLVGFFSTYCYKCSIGGDLGKLRQVVAHMKEDLDPRIPCHLAADIYNEFMEKYSWPREKRVLEIMMELIMDRKIIGLKCSSSNLDSLDFHQLSRINDIQELELTTRLVHLAGLHLGDLRKLTYRENCTDADLKVIGQSCARLEYLDVSHSRKVTDVGLRALGPCTNLSSVAASRCSVSLNGINELLSVNQKIRKLSAWTYDDDEGFDCSDPSALSVYPSIETFAFVPRFPTRNLHQSLAAAVKFPNLRSVKISRYLAEDLSTLRSLSQLSELELKCDGHCTWNNLHTILRSFGATIKKLSFTCSENLDNLQNQLNFIQELCGDLEYLKIMFLVSEERRILFIPHFRKLKTLVLLNHGVSDTDLLNFSHLPELERFVVRETGMTTETIELLICDKTKFPNLKYLDLLELPSRVYMGCLMQRIGKRGRPNLTISYSLSRQYCICAWSVRSRHGHCSTCMTPTRIFEYRF